MWTAYGCMLQILSYFVHVTWYSWMFFFFLFHAWVSPFCSSYQTGLALTASSYHRMYKQNKPTINACTVDTNLGDTHTHTLQEQISERDNRLIGLQSGTIISLFYTTVHTCIVYRFTKLWAERAKKVELAPKVSQSRLQVAITRHSMIWYKHMTFWTLLRITITYIVIYPLFLKCKLCSQSLTLSVSVTLIR